MVTIKHKPKQTDTHHRWGIKNKCYQIDLEPVDGKINIRVFVDGEIFQSHQLVEKTTTT